MLRYDVPSQEPVHGASQVQEVQQVLGDAHVATRPARIPEPRGVSCAWC